MLLIGSKMPSFLVKAVQGNEVITIKSEDLLGSFKLLFFYGLDYSFVCPGEIHALQDNIKEFNKRNTKIIAISVDSIYVHKRVLSTPRSRMGAEGTEFPLVSDQSHRLSRAFNVLDEERGHSFRASFIVDKENIIQYGSANSFAFGRSIKELLRIVDAIQSVQSEAKSFSW